MRTSFLIVLIVLLLTFAATAQKRISKNEDLKNLNIEITKLEQNIAEKKAQKTALEVKFTAEDSKIRDIESELKQLTLRLYSLNEQKRQILVKERAKNLPTSQTELLKLIVLQNDRIIELLEKLQIPK